MRILIVSDSHGNNKYLVETLQRVNNIDLMIHLGDYGGSEEYIKSIAPCPIEMIAGNNDQYKGLPYDKVIQIGDYKVYLTHGHRYGVYFGTRSIKKAAKTRQADIVMFGHTHVPVIDMKDSVWAINPGSTSLPRQRERIPTFMIMDIDNNGEAHFTLNYCK